MGWSFQWMPLFVRHATFFTFVTFFPFNQHRKTPWRSIKGITHSTWYETCWEIFLKMNFLSAFIQTFQVTCKKKHIFKKKNIYIHIKISQIISQKLHYNNLERFMRKVMKRLKEKKCKRTYNFWCDGDCEWGQSLWWEKLKTN